MKKKLLLIPLFATLLCGCTLEDLMFWKKKDQDTEQKDGKEDEDNPPTPSTVHVSSISLSEENIEIEEMQSKLLTYTIFPSNADNKEVEWFTDNSDVATVNEGLIYAIAPGTTIITVKSIDGNKTDTCEVNVTAKEIPVDTITRSICFDDEKPSSGDSKEITEPFTIGEEGVITATFALGEGETSPKIYKNPDKSSEFDARIYTGNTLTISSNSLNIRNIEFGFGRGDSSSVTLESTDNKFSGTTWTGDDDSVTFVVKGSGQRRINTITVQYEGSEPGPEEVVNLGVKSIADVKEYIAENPVKKNDFGNGVNDKRVVTIKGFALAKIDLEKFKEAYGLNVSEPAKVIMADSTGSIGVATKVSGDGTTLWGKIDNHVCQDTAKYVVTGYLSEYLGHPEILVTSFSWDKNLDISWNAEILSEATATISEFYSYANEVNYNCAGHGYGKVLTLNKLKCYYMESDGTGKRYYNFTDGEKSIRVNAFNLSTVSVGNNYDIIGITSIKNLSPIIIGFKVTKSVDQSEIVFDYSNAATDISIANLKNIHGDKEDTSVRYPNVINAYGTVYKTTGYLTLVVENGKYYVGISDSYISRANVISGKDNAMANYGISLIKNENFWNTTESELYKFNPLFDDYVFEDNPITVYYVVRQQRYAYNKAIWEILLIPDFVNDLKA